MFWITENHFLFVGILAWGTIKLNCFWYPGVGTVLHWRNPELENLVPSHPYF